MGARRSPKRGYRLTDARETSTRNRAKTGAVGRRDQVRILIDGMTAANDLGLTHAVPGQIIVHTDGRMRPIELGNLTIQFKRTSTQQTLLGRASSDARGAGFVLVA